ncbi:hypothetical protein [Longitalea arenae]|uniref:hypothetical protein n=1 Tax=Longitalea arenae TaxID=2812558 RepID=UPI001966D2AB|nr:hypothetical protein [Longitalea arenae]
MHRKIQYLQRHQLDTGKWDRCIIRAANGLIYAHTFFLDTMATHWDALVLGDYEAVMPLPWRKKGGIKYLYKPAFIQQLGIFTDLPLTVELMNLFLELLPLHFKYAAVFLNHAHPVVDLPKHSNFILPLQAPYELLRKNYKTDLLKNLKRCERFQLFYSAEGDYSQTLLSFKALYGERLQHITDADYDRLGKVFAYLHKQGRLLVRTVSANGKLLSSAVLLQDAKRLYLMASVTGAEGRSAGANHFLIDALIREFAGTALILDFEGSDQPGIAHFYKNFGSIDQPYFFYTYNRLPWPLRLFKK